MQPVSASVAMSASWYHVGVAVGSAVGDAVETRAQCGVVVGSARSRRRRECWTGVAVGNAVGAVVGVALAAC